MRGVPNWAVPQWVNSRPSASAATPSNSEGEGGEEHGASSCHSNNVHTDTRSTINSVDTSELLTRDCTPADGVASEILSRSSTPTLIGEISTPTTTTRSTTPTPTPVEETNNPTPSSFVHADGTNTFHTDFSNFGNTGIQIGRMAAHGNSAGG